MLLFALLSMMEAWMAAGEPERAIGYLLAAAARARDALAVEETYDLFTRALELAEADEDRRRIRVERALALEQLEDYARADRELAELLPELDGQDEIEALLARGHSTLWTERTDVTIEIGTRAVALVTERGPAELEGPALALLSQGYGMRGDEGDLERALMHGDRAVSTKELARQIGRKTVRPCEPAVAQRHTGYMVGGTSPFGTLKALPVFVERSILPLESIYINGGRRGFLVRLAPSELTRVLGATAVDVAID